MNCQDVSRLLAGGHPLDQEAREHMAGCSFCRALVEAKFEMDETLDRAQIERYKQVATAKLIAVRPMLSDRQLRLVFLALFLCFTVSAIYPTGTAGFRVLTFWQTVCYYGVILLTAIFGATALVQEIVPGTRRYLSTRLVVILECIALLGVVALLFHSLSVARFVASGRGCLTLGSLCAVASGVLFALVVKGGFFVSPVRMGTVGGFLSGLAGFAVLAVHCPVLSVPHIWFWHFGVVPISMAAGALIGFGVQKFSRMA